MRIYDNPAAAVVLCVAAMSLNAPAISESAAATTDKEIEHIVTVAKRRAQSVLDTTLSISKINTKELGQVHHNHIQETLLRVSGVNLHRGNGQEYLPAIRSPVLTGAGACGAFLMAQDGIPLRSAGFCNINELFDAHTEQAQRIEIIRGPGTALQGSNALHGLVNIVTFLPGISAPGLLSLESGSNDYIRLQWAGSEVLSRGEADKHQLSARLTLTDNGGYRQQAGYQQQKLNLYHYREYNNWKLSTGLSFSKLNQETAGFITGLNAFKDKSLSQSNPTPEAYRDSQSIRLWTNLEQTNNLASGRWLITPYLRYTDMDFLQHFLPGDPLEQNGQRSTGLQSSYYFQPTSAVQATLGLDGEFTRGFLKQTQQRETPGSDFLRETIPTGVHYDYQVDATLLAAFAHMDWYLQESWELNLGLRAEYMGYDYDNLALDGRTRDNGSVCGFGGCRYSRPADRRDHFTNVSPKLALSYRLAQEHLLYLSLNHGFRAPQATELYRLQRAQQVADLDSVEVFSRELGIKGQWSANPAQSLRYELTMYHMEKKGVIFRDSDFFNRSNNKTHHQGLETSVVYTHNPRLDINLVANYAQHRYHSDRELNGININGNDMDTAPRVFGSARLAWNTKEGLRGELEWVHMGPYFLDVENRHRYPGHDLLNLRINWQWHPQWRAFARVLNLADKAYAERADYTSFTQHRYFPGEERSLFIGVETTWQ